MPTDQNISQLPSQRLLAMDGNSHRGLHWSMHRKWKTLDCSSLNWTYTSHPSHQYPGIFMDVRAVMDTIDEVALSRHSRQMHILTQGLWQHSMDVSKYQHTGDVCKPQHAKLQHREQKEDMAAHYEVRSHSHLRDGGRESLKYLKMFRMF